MESVTISSKGQIAIPKAIREQLGWGAGTRLNLDIQGTRIVLSKSSDWRELCGAAAGRDLLAAYEQEKAEEKKREDARG